MKAPGKQDYSVIAYTAGYVHEDDTVIPRTEYYRAAGSHVKQFHGALKHLLRLPKCARDLIDYLAETADHNNMVRSDMYLRDTFSKLVEKLTDGEVSYRDSTVKAAFGQLEKAGLLIKRNKGVYLVNPEYFFRLDESKRKDCIKLMLEFDVHVPGATFKKLPAIQSLPRPKVDAETIPGNPEKNGGPAAL